MKSSTRGILWALALLGALCVGIILGRMSVQIQRGSNSFIGFVDGYEENQATAAFEEFVETWKSFVKENDGWLPADPYRGLIESGKVESYSAFYCRKFVTPLPPRLNPELSRNPQRVVLTWTRYDIDEVWTAYADGTWKKRSFADSSQDDYDWHTSMSEAGYPAWKSLREKDEWIARNRSTLVWDDRRQLYVPSSSTTNPAPPDPKK